MLYSGVITIPTCLGTFLNSEIDSLNLFNAVPTFVAVFLVQFLLPPKPSTESFSFRNNNAIELVIYLILINAAIKFKFHFPTILLYTLEKNKFTAKIGDKILKNK